MWMCSGLGREKNNSTKIFLISRMLYWMKQYNSNAFSPSRIKMNIRCFRKKSDPAEAILQGPSFS